MTTNAQGVRETAGERIEESVQGSDSPAGTVSHVNGRKGRGRLIISVTLIALGSVFLLNNLGLFSWWQWDVLWPLVIVCIGAALLAYHFPRRTQ